MITIYTRPGGSWTLMEVAKRIASQKVLWTPSQAIVHASQQGAHDGNSIISESALNLDRQRRSGKNKQIGKSNISALNPHRQRKSGKSKRSGKSTISALDLDRQRKFQSKKIGGSFQSKKRIASTIVLSSPAVAKSKSSPAVAKGLRSPAAAMQILKAG